MEPLVSVIIPTYNCAMYIEEAVDSVLAQSFKKYEIIVIDDGSTDSTREKTAKYKDKIRYIYQENQGVSSARNHGINAAGGSLIAFLDADDKFLPDKLEKQTGVFTANPAAAMVHSGMRIIDQPGETISEIRWWEDFPVLDVETFFIYKPIYLGAMMIKKDALLEAGGFNTGFRVAEDIDLVFRLLLHGCRAAWLKQVTVCYREHRESVTNRDFAASAHEAHEIIVNFFSRKDLPASIRRLEKQSIYDHLLWCAWKFYMNNQEKRMVQFLEKSVKYSTFPKWVLEDEWLAKFQSMTESSGRKFDRNKLRTGRGWKKLIKKIAKEKLKMDPR